MTCSQDRRGDPCAVEGCPNPQRARGWCASHHSRWLKWGDPRPDIPLRRVVPGDAETRFWARVEQTNTCWLWTGTIVPDGYGQLKVDGRGMSAHRFAYRLLVGEPPAGLQLDHLCRVRNCVNPAHLEPVTSRENTLRGMTRPAENAAKTECVHGHPFDETNTIYERGWRVCRTCRNRRARERRARRRGAAA